MIGNRVSLRRRLTSRLVVLFCGVSVVLALVPVVMILFFILGRGLSSLNLDFFTQMPKPVGEPGGGMANAIVGSLIIVGMGGALAVPAGVLAGVFLSEYPRSRLASACRFAADVLAGVPSIVVGIFAYGVAVLPFKGFSALAGSVALAVMMVPIVARTSEEILRLVPSSLRAGAMALGATRRRAVFSVILPAALPGVLTGILVALARIAGETAPLLFTAFGNRFWSTDPTRPMASLTVQIYNYAISPYEDWHRQAWAASAVLVLLVLALSILARLATRRLERMHR
jgi:phosphate transport system permease protein